MTGDQRPNLQPIITGTFTQRSSVLSVQYLRERRRFLMEALFLLDLVSSVMVHNSSNNDNLVHREFSDQ